MYYVLNKGDVKDIEIEYIMDIVVDSLFLVFVILGIVFIIWCLRGNVVEMVVEKLDKKFWENIWDVRSSFFISDNI